MPLTTGEADLRLLARELLTRGCLPYRNSVRIWAGRASNRTCSLCGAFIAREEIEYEVEAKLDGATQVFFFHRVCHEAWHFEASPPPHLRRLGDGAAGKGCARAARTSPTRSAYVGLVYVEQSADESAPGRK